MSQIEDKLKQMGYELPDPPTPLANYIPGYKAGNIVFLSGVGPRANDGTTVTGKLGQDLTVEQGYEAARLCGLNLLANLSFRTKVNATRWMCSVHSTNPEQQVHWSIYNACKQR